jgi:hypothetical protein
MCFLSIFLMPRIQVFAVSERGTMAGQCRTVKRMSKLLSVWLVGLLVLAPHPSALLWIWLFAPALLVPLLALHWMTPPR